MPRLKPSYQSITTQEQLGEICDRMSSAQQIGFDTEFVSEDTYRPELCLIQLAIDGVFAVVDPVQLDDLTPFWDQLANGDHETVVHSGRQEIIFCWYANGKTPRHLFDTQIAAGLIGMEFPAGYGALISKCLGHRPGKGETRTDWRRRPLTKRQLAYAVEDVSYLTPLRDMIYGELAERNRLDWFGDEIAAWTKQVVDSQSEKRWRRVSGISGLSNRSLAIVKELWMWRNEQAQLRNAPPKRVLRDDLLVEIARRQNADSNQILSIRGLNRSVRQAAPELADCVRRGLAVRGDLGPGKNRTKLPPQLNLLGQFLACALSSRCREVNVAPSLVGTLNDVREMISYRLGLLPPDDVHLLALAEGWRAEVVGNLIDELLDGSLAIRIGDPRANLPLVFEHVTRDKRGREKP